MSHPRGEKPEEITPDLLLRAYASGLFPMADDREDKELFWVDPDERGIFPLESIHFSRSLLKTVRQDRLKVTTNTAFRKVMQLCAEPAKDRPNTWISHRIESLYTTLFSLGHAHSVECWLDDELVGGLYGVSLAGAFFGESMFHRATNASKVAFVHLVARLKAGGYSLLDTQFSTSHLASLGVIEVPRGEYQSRLADALQREGDWSVWPVKSDPLAVLQAITHTS